MTPALRIMPSILGADVGNLEPAVRAAEAGGADGIHIDIMDGHFVPNISFSPSVVEMANRVTGLHLNTHLMLSRPDRYAEVFAKAGSDTLLFHIEAECDAPDLLRAIRGMGIRAGIVLNPDTAVDRVLPLLEAVDEVLFMTVFPGFGGQSFISGVMPGMARLREACPGLDIAVDGGLNRETCLVAREAGANIFHLGSHLFRAEDLGDEIAWLRGALQADSEDISA